MHQPEPRFPGGLDRCSARSGMRTSQLRAKPSRAEGRSYGELVLALRALHLDAVESPLIVCRHWIERRRFLLAMKRGNKLTSEIVRRPALRLRALEPDALLAG